MAITFPPSPPNHTTAPSSETAMAINLYPDRPRISFSHDLDHHPSPYHLAGSEQILFQPDPSSNHSDFDSDFDFGFCFPACRFVHDTSPADELFSDGMIIPTNMRQRNSEQPPSLEASRPKKEETEGEKIITTSTKASLIREAKGHSKSVWRFTRNSSLNYDSSHGKETSIWSLPLLPRSNSTGSSPPLQRTTKHGHGRLHSYKHLTKPSSSSSSCSSTGFHQTPPLRNGHGVLGFGGSASASTVLNVPPPYITKGTSDLLGLGSLFRHGNHKKSKKR